MAGSSYPITVVDNTTYITISLNQDSYTSIGALAIDATMSSANHVWNNELNTTPISVPSKLAVDADRFGTATFIHNYEDVIVYETETHTGDMVMVNEEVSGLSASSKEKYTYDYTYSDVSATDKYAYTEVDSITSNTLQSTEFLRVLL